MEALPGALDYVRAAMTQHPNDADLMKHAQAVLDSADAARALRIDAEKRAQAKAEADAVKALRIEKERQAEADRLTEEALAQPVATWSNATVCSWLQRIDLAEHSDKFFSLSLV